MSVPSPDAPQRPTLAALCSRSLLPLAAVGLLSSTLLIGPFGFLAATVAWWQVVRRIR
jgi:hypothetical protein